jgi:hypothetical protein
MALLKLNAKPGNPSPHNSLPESRDWALSTVMRNWFQLGNCPPALEVTCTIRCRAPPVYLDPRRRCWVDISNGRHDVAAAVVQHPRAGYRRATELKPAAGTDGYCSHRHRILFLLKKRGSGACLITWASNIHESCPAKLMPALPLPRQRQRAAKAPAAKKKRRNEKRTKVITGTTSCHGRRTG